MSAMFRLLLRLKFDNLEIFAVFSHNEVQVLRDKNVILGSALCYFNKQACERRLN